MVSRMTFDMAISAPVLPADTATPARPSLTASMACHIELVRRPRLSAWLGLSSMEMNTELAINSERLRTRG
jgi:hypothetical protein